jgi:hypothetical protein
MNYVEPILEGIVAYAAYTQDMDKSRSKYFSIYTPLGTMDAKLHMEKFLNDYTDHLDAINFVQNTAVSCGDLYSMLFPSSLKRRSAESGEQLIN